MLYIKWQQYLTAPGAAGNIDDIDAAWDSRYASSNMAKGTIYADRYWNLIRATGKIATVDYKFNLGVGELLTIMGEFGNTADSRTRAVSLLYSLNGSEFTELASGSFGPGGIVLNGTIASGGQQLEVIARFKIELVGETLVYWSPGVGLNTIEFKVDADPDYVPPEPPPPTLIETMVPLIGAVFLVGIVGKAITDIAKSK